MEIGTRSEDTSLDSDGSQAGPKPLSPWLPPPPQAPC